MNITYPFIKSLIDLAASFSSEVEHSGSYSLNIDGFKNWVVDGYSGTPPSVEEPYWEGKEKGRSPESVINTLIVHMNRYAKSYSKAAIYGSEFSTQEDFIYLINLKSLGQMTKTELVKKNVHEKPVGMQIIGRLLANGWIAQEDSPTDKRSKLVSITPKGEEALEKQMHKIRHATQIVTGDLTYAEKINLIRLLNKLNEFHLPIYDKNIAPEYLLDEVPYNNNNHTNTQHYDNNSNKQNNNTYSNSHSE